MIRQFVFSLNFALLTAVLCGANDAEASKNHARLTGGSVAMTGDAFIYHAASSDRDQYERTMIFMIGVLDTSEGKFWCDYQTFKTITLYEAISEHIKKLSPERRKERASRLIQEAATELFPCRRNDK